MSVGEVCSFPCCWWINSVRVCVRVRIDRGGLWRVWWGVLECQVCIYQCVHWSCISEGRLSLLCECLRGCTFAYLCDLRICLYTRVPGWCMCVELTQNQRHAWDRWSSGIRFYLCGSSIGRFWINFYMNNGSSITQLQTHRELLLTSFQVQKNT